MLTGGYCRHPYETQPSRRKLGILCPGILGIQGQGSEYHGNAFFLVSPTPFGTSFIPCFLRSLGLDPESYGDGKISLRYICR